jgi:hypothetical protein
MPTVMQYTCRQELWPVLEIALASYGYSIDTPIQRSSSGASAMVMKHGTVSLLFTRRPASDRFTIEIWGEACDAVIQLLESLPFKLNRPLGASLLERAV